MSLEPPFSSVREFISVLRDKHLSYTCNANVEFPIVSIISSFYNDAGYFEDTYNSVINQTFQNYEWIIIDDCSTDCNSISIFDSLKQRNSQIKTFRHQENKGPAAGRNKGVSYAKGKYIFFLDTDDIIEPTYIEKCVLFLETHPEFSIVNSYSVGFQDREYWWNKGFNTPSRFIEENLVTGRLLYKKTDFERLGGYDETLRYGEDWDLWLKAFSNGQKAYTIPEYLDCYRCRKSGLSQIAWQNNKQTKHIKKLVKNRYSDFFSSASLADIDLSCLESQNTTLGSRINVTNILNCTSKQKSILYFLPNLKINEENILFVKFLQEINPNSSFVTIAVMSDDDNKLHSEIYNITSEIFYLCNLFDYSNWVSFTNYMISSRSINTIIVYNIIYYYYLIPQIKKTNPQVLHIGVSYFSNNDSSDSKNLVNASQYLKFSDIQLIDKQLLIASNDIKKMLTTEENIYCQDFRDKNTFIKLITECLNYQLTNYDYEQKKIESSNKLKDQAYWETAIWIQKYIKLEYKYNMLYEQKRKNESLNIWAKNLEKERNIYQNQAKAWIRAAKLNQLDINKLESELASIKELVDPRISE